ncbi:hypothetical protein [Psychrosphaera algicola]|uniref:Uncharacterized protein n=1 Tax=Psychrosphaera algicola TaxID=3023714 RepID=A0ABT5FC26_9GAMM|nr:hypothetical protein [Psychrosphaera sp. G1-22]MDC2888126.1 hypothetical protein [Psychrosphaera sp. G1-22]
MQKFDNSEHAFKTAPMASFVRKLKLMGVTGYLGLVAYYPMLFFVLDPNANNLAYITLVLFWLPMLTAIPEFT